MLCVCLCENQIMLMQAMSQNMMTLHFDRLEQWSCLLI